MCVFFESFLYFRLHFILSFCPFSRERKIESSQQSNLCRLVLSFSVFSMRICLTDRKEVCWVWCMVFLSTLFHSWIYSLCCKVLVWSVGGRCVCVHLCCREKSVWKGLEASRLHSTKTNKSFVHKIIPYAPPFLKKALVHQDACEFGKTNTLDRP